MCHLHPIIRVEVSQDEDMRHFSRRMAIVSWEQRKKSKVKGKVAERPRNKQILRKALKRADS
jgi:hypothetical protein